MQCKFHFISILTTALFMTHSESHRTAILLLTVCAQQREAPFAYIHSKIYRGGLFLCNFHVIIFAFQIPRWLFLFCFFFSPFFNTPLRMYTYFIAATNEVLYRVTKERMGHEMLKEFPYILSLESNRLYFGIFCFTGKNSVVFDRRRKLR